MGGARRRIERILSRAVIPVLVAVTAAIGAAPAQSAPPVVIVSVIDFEFDPPTARARRYGATVRWEFNNRNYEAHTAADGSGMGLFYSGVKAPGTNYEFTFVAAGTYPVVCTIHYGMESTIKVPMRASPPAGDPDTIFTIIWASEAPPEGYVFDVQIRRPGADWAGWKVGVQRRKAPFIADSGPLDYSFRARLRNTANGKASDYSPAVTIQVR